MPSHPRKDLVREGEVACYHVWSRCVQQIWLCGQDVETGIDYSHRKEWVEKLFEYQTGVFAVDLGAYHVLSNHLHANPCTRPDVAATWSHEEIAWRWKMAWPRWEAGEWYREPSDREVETVLAKGSEHLETLRCNLSSLSWYMARCKEPVARLANAEAGTSGHMWAERFGCRELTDEGERLTSLIYTELQQVKCGAAPSLEASNHSSIQNRLRAWAAEQSREIVNDFRGRKAGDGEHHLPPEVVEQMLLDSWLMPFSDESPLLLMRKELQVEPLSPIKLDGVTPDGPHNTDPNAQKRFQVGEGSSREIKSLQIHQQFFPNLHEITMRRPLLEIPRAKYLEIVQRAATAWRQSEVPPDRLIDTKRPPRMAEDGTIGSWRVSFKQFRAFLRNAAKKSPLLRSALARGDPNPAPSNN